MSLRKLNFSLLLLVGCFFIAPLQPKAEECTYKEINRLQELASKIKISYENQTGNNFSITMKQIEKGLYIKDNESGRSFMLDPNDPKSTSSSSEGYVGGRSYSFAVYVTAGTPCSSEKLRTLYVTLPIFNSYSLRKECTEYKDFSLCKKWIDTSKIDADTFTKRLEEYKSGSKEITTDPTNNKKSGGFLDFLSRYYLLALVFIVIIGGAIIGILKYREKIAYERGDKL